MIKVKTFTVGYISNNCYLVYADNQRECILIDPAKGYEKITATTAELNLTVSAVLVTHGHFDHILDAAKWERAGATIYIHQLDQDKLHSRKNLAPNMLTVEEPQHEMTIKDGDVIKVGEIEVKVMHTPGHTVGSCCFIIDNMIFSGDTLFCNSIGRTDFFDSSYPDMQQSLCKLVSLQGDYIVYPGHEESTTLNYERRHNIYLK